MSKEFKKYQHLERFGTIAVEGIDVGECYIFPKIDGTNSQLWFDDKLCAGSRNRELSLDNDNAGFYNWAVKQDKLLKFFEKHPNLRLYGEWLVPHTLKTYSETAWRNFYVFDILKGDEYLHYEVYKQLLEEFAIEFIPPICKITNPSYDRLILQLEKNGYLIQDGKGIGEGIVVKNYDYKNKFGNIIWAKIVSNEFKTSHGKYTTTELKENKLVEEEIVNKFVTLALVEKEFSKIALENGWASKYIPRLLNTVFYCLVVEDGYNIIKEFKSPTINFKTLDAITTAKIKELMPHLF